MTVFDPWFTGHISHRSPDEITRCLRESIADLLAAANDPDRPRRPQPYEPDVDGDTKIRGGKSRRALARERRPVSAATDELGYDAWGHWVPGGEG